MANVLAALAPLPPGALVPVEWLRRFLNDDAAPSFSEDLLDVDAIARLLDRSPSTARALCASGRIAAFRLNGREWRCRGSDVRDFLDAERERHAAEREAPPASKPRGARKGRRLDSWRTEVEA